MFSSRMSLYIAAFIFPSILTSLPVPAAEKHPHSMMLPPPCFTVGVYWPGDEQCLVSFKHQTWHSGQRVQTLSHQNRELFLIVWGLQVHFGKLQTGCHVPFTKEWLPSGHSTIQAWLVDCCRDGCPSGRFSSLHRGMLELWQWPSDSWSPPWLRPFSPDRSV